MYINYEYIEGVRFFDLDLDINIDIDLYEGIVIV